MIFLVVNFFSRYFIPLFRLMFPSRHPTIERLFHAKLMSDGFETENWATDPEEETVCTRSSCYDDDGEYGQWDACCYGHYEKSKMLDFEKGSKSDYIGITNGEAIKATNPTLSSYSVPYIYDQFTWDHCEEDGTSSDLNAILQSNYEAAQARRRRRH